MKTLRNPQPYGEQATGPLKGNGISILTLDPQFFVQYELVTSLKQTAGGSQRLTHIRDVPSGVRVPSSTCLDPKPSLSIVLNV